MPKRSAIKTVGLIVKRDRAQALEIARELAAMLRGRSIEVLAEARVAPQLSATALSPAEIARRADLIVVLGGDGTLLSIARLIGNRETPILGINLGGLGFLSEATTDEGQSALTRILSGDYDVDRRITLEATLSDGRRTAAASEAEAMRALNDVVINKRELGRMLELEVVADRQPFCSYRADGLIIATPTGSTAYALSAGGPIVFPTLSVMLLAPICPHTLTNRPVVLPDGFEIEVRVKSADVGATLTLDGKEMATLGANDTVKIRKGKNAVVLIRSAHPYFEIWRDKLHWG